MSDSETYRRIRTRLIALADHLGPDVHDQIVLATPQWTVTDVYRHLAGSCDDILEGRLDGVTTDPWTQAQVVRRAEMTLPEVVAEWTGLAPRIDSLLDELGASMDPRFFIDVWSHEQDLRGTVRRPGGADDTVTTDYLAGAVKGACIRVRKAGLAPVGIVAGQVRNQSGDEPVIRLEVTPFEFLRGTLGRRSRRQLRAWAWTPAGEAGVRLDDYLDALMVFGMATDDVIDAI